MPFDSSMTAASASNQVDNDIPPTTRQKSPEVMGLWIPVPCPAAP
jgi:hypothetical protein